MPISASARFCGTARRSVAAGERPPQIVGERRPGAHCVDAGLVARMRRHRRDIAGGEHRCGSAGRAQRLVNQQKSAFVERQPGIGQKRRAARLGDPQRLVEFDRAAFGRDQPAGLDGSYRRVGQHPDAALFEDAGEQLAHAAVVRWQQTLARDQRHLGRGAEQLREPVLRRQRQLDPAGAAADDRQPQTRHLPRRARAALPSADRNGRSA